MVLQLTKFKLKFQPISFVKVSVVLLKHWMWVPLKIIHVKYIIYTEKTQNTLYDEGNESVKNDKIHKKY